MIKRDAAVKFLDAYLGAAKIRDASKNGLQVEGKENVKKIVFGVSASLEFFRRAAASGADMAVVHHGIIWDRPETPVTGRFRKKLAVLFENNISLVAYHLPLDMHGVCGNNAQILSWLTPASKEKFGEYDGQLIGFKGKLRRALSLDEVCGRLAEKLGAKPAALAFGPAKIKTAAVISGGAADMVTQAIAAGADVFITGNADEPTQEICRESKINFVSAGHYNSEKAGILALKKIIAARFSAETEFIDVPNPF